MRPAFVRYCLKTVDLPHPQGFLCAIAPILPESPSEQLGDKQ